MILFLYGTLKRNCCRNCILKGKFIKEITTKYNYRMFDVGGFPALVEVSIGGDSIQGELWEVDESMLSDLDLIEGVEHNLYKRSRIFLSDDTEAICYLWQRSTENLKPCGNIWVE